MDISPETLQTAKKNSGRAGRYARTSALVLAGIVTGSIGSAVGPVAMQAVAASRPTPPASCKRNTFPAECLRVVDGDTLECRLALTDKFFWVTKVRLLNVDTPEVFGPIVKRDMVRGPLATEFTQNWIDNLNGFVEIVVFGDDKYGGRVDGTIYPRGGGQSLSDALTLAGHAK